MIEIRKLDKKDYKKARMYACNGMNFNLYFDNKFLLSAYTMYFWCLELNRATDVYGAYINDEFVGLIMAQIYDKKTIDYSVLRKFYVYIVDIIQKVFFKDSAGIYEKTVHMQLKHYKENNKPEGEIIFLAADPACSVKGIGTALLNELSKNNKGKTIYLHTDDACTYQFYEHRGFIKEEEDDIVLLTEKGEVPLKCLLYSKEL